MRGIQVFGFCSMFIFIYDIKLSLFLLFHFSMIFLRILIIILIYFQLFSIAAVLTQSSRPSPSSSISPMSTPSSTTVLVTGGSGFIGSYVILALLSAGYTVRTTIRSLSREASVRSTLTNGGATSTDLNHLSFAAASLDSDDGWTEAVQGCTYVHHVASPLPVRVTQARRRPHHPRPRRNFARFESSRCCWRQEDCADQQLRSCRIRTCTAQGAFTEEDWTVLDDSSVKVTPYMKSKAIAERAAWDFINSDANSGKMELAVVIPLLVCGPVLGKEISTSVQVIKKLMDGSMPGCPNLSFALSMSVTSHPYTSSL